MEDIAARRAAETLLREHKANATFKPLGAPDRPAAISDAYDIQERYVALLKGEHGDAVGYKVGLTSAAMQTFCGIDHPIAGVVLARRVHANGSDRAAFGFRAAGPGIRNRRSHHIGRPGHRRAVHRRNHRASHRRRMRGHRNRGRSQRRLCQPRCAFAGGGQFLERRHCAVGIFDKMARSGGACSGAPPRTVLRSAKATAATSSAIPSIQSPGLPRNWLRGAWG